LRPRLKIHAKLLKTLSNKTKKTNKNEHVDGVTNSVQPVVTKDELEEKLARKFWEIYASEKSWDSKIDEWNKFDSLMIERYYDHLPLVKLYLHLDKEENFSIVNYGDRTRRWRFSFGVTFLGTPKRTLEISGVDFLNSFSSVLRLINCGFLLERVVCEGLVQFVLEKFDSESEGLGGNDFPPDFFRIYESDFKKRVSFRIEESSGVETLEIRGCFFRGDLEFLAHKNFTSFKSLTFRNLKLEGNVIMEHYEVEMEEELINGGSKVGELNFDGCFFEGVLNLRLITIQSLNFSESQIDYKKIFCSEYSLLEPAIINKDDEPKFRFLKKYFADQGNHSNQ
jgi:hypothetical protein